MSFQDIYKKYKDGTASDKEKIIVLDELEKYKTLTDDYLDDQSDDYKTNNYNEGDTGFAGGSDSNDIKIIRKRERTRNIRLILIAVIIATLVFLAYIFAITPLLNKYVFFGPETSTISKSGQFSDLQIELDTLTSLHNPFAKVGYISGEETGLGEYDLTIQLINKDDPSNPKYEYGYIKNGKAVLKPFSETTTMYGGHFDISRSGMTQKEVDEENRTEIKKLCDLESKFTAARTEITLKDDIDMEELANLIKRYGNLNFEWVGIVANEGRYSSPLLGMNLERSFMMIHEDDKAKDGNYPGFTEIEYSKAGLESHFLQMLEFQEENIDLVNRVLEIQKFGSMWYSGVIDYVKENGIKAYGLVIKGNPTDIINFYNDVSTLDISVRDIMFNVE